MLPATRVLLITTLEGLAGDPGADPPWLDGGGPIGAATARQLACDAQLTPIMFDSTGRPLDVGRTRRLATDEQRLAVAARDQACIGCHAPIIRCQVHHHRWWGREHGRTDVDNLRLLFSICHTNVHLGHWHATRHPDGTFTTAPATISPPTNGLPSRSAAGRPPPDEGDRASAGRDPRPHSNAPSPALFTTAVGDDEP